MAINGSSNQGFVKGEEIVLDIVIIFFMEVKPANSHGESTFTASQLSQKMNIVPLLLQNLGFQPSIITMIDPNRNDLWTFSLRRGMPPVL